MSKKLAHVLEAKWRSDDVNTNEERDFSYLHLDKRVLDGLLKAGYRIPSPVQLQAIPLCLTGDDVFVQGKAGTGKTLVFSILALTAVLEAEDIKVLIVAPTREGAFQIYNTICAIGSEIQDLKCEYFIGGLSYSEDVPKASNCKIAVGTPGRILHLIKDDKLKVDTIRLFIIDDVDELLLNDATEPKVGDIHKSLPEKKQTVVASLTCTAKVIELASEFLKHPFQSCFSENGISLLGMTHYYRIVQGSSMALLSYREKLKILKSVLSEVKFTQCVIFCNSVFRIEPLCIDIQQFKLPGLSALSISKTKDQVERLRVVELLKSNKCQVLVSTDLSSRGLDAENVDLVINFDMPSTCHAYLHRCGRAGRYGAKCSSITFILRDQTEEFDKIENKGHFISYALPEPIPEDLSCDIVNLEKTTAKEDCSVLNANENGLTDLEDNDEGSSVSKIVPKCMIKRKSTPKRSEEYVPHKAFDEMHLEREENCSKNITKIPQRVQNKKKSYKICCKKSVKSLDLFKNQIKSEKQVKFHGLRNTSSEFDANHACSKFHPGSPGNHMDKKRVSKNCKMNSQCGEYVDRCCLSETSNFNEQTNPCHGLSRPCCHFPYYYFQPPFPLHMNDIHYQHLMFIHNFFNFISCHHLKC